MGRLIAHVLEGALSEAPRIAAVSRSPETAPKFYWLAVEICVIRPDGATDRYRACCVHEPQPIMVAGRRLVPTPVFDTYWRFAAERQFVYLARLRHESPPWSDDQILCEHRFTNVFRAADRVSQFLLRHVLYNERAPRNPEDVLFRVLLFKLFNKVATWQHLERELGEIKWSTYDFAEYSRLLDAASGSGPIYAAAYVMPPPRMGEARKHRNHLRLLEHMMRTGLAEAVVSSESLEDVYSSLYAYPSLGRFLAFQFTIDLNYSSVLNADEDDFVVAGPGARDGVRKCFGREARGIEEEVIRYMVDSQEAHFERLGLNFEGLFGRRLHLIDCQNLFCEVDKYARVAHPDVAGISGRTRIKQRFRPQPDDPSTPVFPPKWALRVPKVERPVPCPRPTMEVGAQGSFWD